MASDFPHQSTQTGGMGTEANSTPALGYAVVSDFHKNRQSFTWVVGIVR
jgi:hypothetical protein